MSLTSLLDSSGNPVIGALVAEDHRVFTNVTFGELSFQPIDQVKLLGGYRYKKHSMFGHEEKEHRGGPRPRSAWPLPVLAALMLHGAAFTLILTVSLAPRQSPMLAGEAVPVTLYAAVPGQAAVVPQATPPAPQMATATEIKPPKPAPVPESKAVADPPKPVSIAPAPRHIAKTKNKPSNARPKARTQTLPQAAKSRTAPTGDSGKTTPLSATSTASTGAPGGTANAVIPARPRYRKNPPPPYPELARRRQMEGTVVLEALVNARGRVDNLAVHASSGHALLDNAALKAVRNWLFVPGKKGGVPMAMTVRVPVRFDLR